jgi:hypothetical protein
LKVPTATGKSKLLTDPNRLEHAENAALKDSSGTHSNTPHGTVLELLAEEAGADRAGTPKH